MVTKVSQAIKQNLWAFIVGPLIKMIEAVFDLLIPLFMKAVIDLSFGNSKDAISSALGDFISLFGVWIKDNPSLNYAVVGGVIILLMGIIGFMTTMVCQYIAAYAATKVGTTMRNSLYKQILSLSKKDLEIFGPNKALTILNADSYQVQQGVLFFIRLGVRAPFIILGSLIISFILDWQIGLVFLAIIPIILFIVFFVMQRASKQYLVIQSKLDDLSTMASDDLEGSRVVRAFNKTDYEEANFGSGTKEYEKEAIRVSKMNAWINPLTFAVVSLATIAVVLLGGFAMADNVSFLGHALLPSTIITEVSYLDQIFQTLVLLTNLVLIFTKSLVSNKRCNELLSITPTIVNQQNGLTKKINNNGELFNFNHVELAYKDGGNKALTDINFSLRKGQSLGIIGGTGSGKSTLINLMERFLDCSKGEIEYKSINIKDYQLNSLRQEIGLVPQKSVLFKGTIRFNFQMSNPNVTDENIIKALKESAAYEFVSKYPDFLDHEVEEGGKNFSGGQRQRLCIARALVANPEVLIMDDSTSALDLLTDKTVREDIKKDYPSLTKVIISQRVSTVLDCDLILVLEGGHIVAKGKHEELLKNCPIYLETFESQTRKEA
ncbi:MAG: ABC transporter ATP-binding protein [Bacilli bacterium]|jgi:ATP-binding cassette subfamily B protein